MMSFALMGGFHQSLSLSPQHCVQNLPSYLGNRGAQQIPPGPDKPAPADQAQQDSGNRIAGSASMQGGGAVTKASRAAFSVNKAMLS